MASPGAARVIWEVLYEIDVRHLLDAIRVPVSLVHLTGDRNCPVEGSRYIARRAGACLRHVVCADRAVRYDAGMRSVHTIALSKRTERVTISLPSELLHSFDALLVEDREGRSSAIRRLIESALREAREREDVERWIESYRNDPQDEEELAWSEAVAADSLRRVAWK